MKKEIQKELESLAPKLSKLEKRERMDAPKGYFESLPDEILSKVNEGGHVRDEQSVTSSSPFRIISIFKSPMSIGIAASLALLIGYIQFSNLHTSNGELNISEQDAFAYIDFHLDEFESDLFIELDLLESEDLVAVNSDYNDVDDMFYEELMNDLDINSLEEVFQ